MSAKLLSLLLQYPDGELLAARAELVDEALATGDRRIARFARWYADQPPDALQRAYVDAFDFNKRASLHLTYHVQGDSRRRGVALLALKERYAAAGMPLADERELPDYLPLMLEFAALAPEPGRELLARQREALELVRAALHEQDSPWADLLDAVCAGLPAMSARQRARAERLAQEGPPYEEVGLEPYAGAPR